MKNILIMIGILLSQLPAQHLEEGMEYIFPDEKPGHYLLNWRVKWGDSSSWSDSGYDDTHWERHPGVGLWASENRPGKGIRWYRKTIFFPEPLDSLAIIALYQVCIVSANEIYWDGKLITRNGITAKSVKEEITGESGKISIIPNNLATQGRHVIALRISNFHGFSGIIDEPLQLGYFTRLHEKLFRTQAISLFLAGIFFLTALFHIALLFGQRNKWPYILFSAFCFSCALYILIRGLLRYFHFDLTHYYTLAALNDIPWFFMITLLPIFFLFEFENPHRIKLSIIICLIAFTLVLLPRLVMSGIIPATMTHLFEQANMIHAYSTILISIAVAWSALFEKKVGSFTAILGLIIFLLGIYITQRVHMENGWALGFAVLNGFTMISLSRQMAHRNLLLQEADLRSARLEIELLKKHIQPHFLLNSLNSIIAWLEEEPHNAAVLVKALADELRMLLLFSGESLISLNEEINLCRAHLQVMSLRHDKQFHLDVIGLRGDETLPPLIIHTLVENGLTHGCHGKDSALFILSCTHSKKRLQIKLFNDSSATATASPCREGTGMRYVKTRLEEAYPGCWELTYGPAENGWYVNINIERNSV